MFFVGVLRPLLFALSSVPQRVRNNIGVRLPLTRLPLAVSPAAPDSIGGTVGWKLSAPLTVEFGKYVLKIYTYRSR